MAALPDLDSHDSDPSAATASASASASDLPPSASPDDDHDRESRPSLDDPGSPDRPPPKRKGGRKPVYATVEERKQRNRQAQAAFRERRTEYIKQLELTLKQHEQLLQTTQNDQHAVAHECSALRYKISTLEKIMAERGIDVEAELRAKGENQDIALSAYSPMGRPKPQPLPLPIGSGSQYEPRRSVRGLAPKVDLRGKMAQLQPSIASPADPQPQSVPWQHPSPADALVMSPAASHFRGMPSPIYAMPNQAFAEQRAYGHPQAEYDSRQLGHPILPSPTFGEPVGGQHDPSLRGQVQHEDPSNMQTFHMPNGMNGLGKLGQFDFYPQS